jgi:predicted site-specific integrase-resolvase
MYLSAYQATKKIGVSSDTLRRWYKQGKITAKTSPSGIRLYDVSSLLPELTYKNDGTPIASTASTSSISSTSTIPTLEGYLYARVSSVKQKEDLERQKELLLSRFPTYKLLSDISSGVNFKHPGLKTLLERASRGIVSEVVVTHRDRLCRFAFDLLQYIFSLHSAKLMVLFNESTSDEQELTEDILAINTVFICRMQGKRAARYRRERQSQPETQENTQGNSSTQKATTFRKYTQLHIESQSLSKSPSEANPQTMAWTSEICL